MAGLGLMVVNPCILGGLETNDSCKSVSHSRKWSGLAWPFACSLLRNLGLYCYFGLDGLQIQDSNIVRNFFVRFS